MIHIVNNENGGVIRCRVVYVDTEWATLDWNVFKFVDELQRAGRQQVRKKNVSLTCGNVRPGSTPRCARLSSRIAKLRFSYSSINSLCRLLGTSTKRPKLN